MRQSFFFWAWSRLEIFISSHWWSHVWHFMSSNEEETVWVVFYMIVHNESTNIYNKYNSRYNMIDSYRQTTYLYANYVWLKFVRDGIYWDQSLKALLLMLKSSEVQCVKHIFDVLIYYYHRLMQNWFMISKLQHYVCIKLHLCCIRYFKRA